MQELGNSEHTVISQKVVTEEINNLKNNAGINEYPVFDENVAYPVGSVVNYNGKLYKFRVYHAAGSWSFNDVNNFSLYYLTDKQEIDYNSLLNGGGILVKDVYTKEHFTTNLDIRIYEGETYYIKFKSSDKTNTNIININIHGDDGSVFTSSTISISNGEGLLVYEATKDGVLGSFGYYNSGLSSSNADVEYLIYTSNSSYVTDIGIKEDLEKLQVISYKSSIQVENLNKFSKGIIAFRAYASKEKIQEWGTDELYLKLGYYQNNNQFYIQCDDVYPVQSPLLVDVKWPVDNVPTGIYEYTYSDANYTFHLIIDADIITTLSYVGCKVKFINKDYYEDYNAEINNIKEDLAEINGEAISVHYKTCEYGPDKPYTYSFGDISFKAGQKVIFHLETDSTANVTILGNPVTSNGSSPTFTLNSSSPIDKTYTFSTDGVLGSYGNKTAYSSDFTVYFTISIFPADVSLSEKIGELEENCPKFDFDMIQANPTEFDNKIRRTPGYSAIFRNWGFIGDSLCSGEMECYNSEGAKVYVDMYEYSWGQHLCRLCGSEGYNFSKGGMQAKMWLTTTDERCWSGCRENPKQAYIIALGVNDSSREETTVGNIETDIDFSNPENNADTFAGNYAKIIQNLKSIQPKCIIFTVTMPRSNVSDWNNVIKGMANKFDNVFCIDLSNYEDLYNSEEFRAKYYMNGHLNAMGYLYTAYLFMQYIDWIVQKNADKFRDVSLIGTNYRANL